MAKKSKPTPAYRAILAGSKRTPYLKTIPADATQELESLLAEFIVADHQKSKKLLLNALNKSGFRSDDTMMAIDTLQRRLAVRPTLYARLVALADTHALKPPAPPLVFGNKRKKRRY